MLPLKDHVRGNVRFTRYKKGFLYYENDLGMEFSVPIDDTGDAEFKREDKAILFMRYIRKQYNLLAKEYEDHVDKTIPFLEEE